jgi:autotransporter-associated beta strand protein
VVISGGNLVLQQADQIADTSTISISAGALNLGTNNETVAGVQLINGTIAGTTGVLTSTTAFDLQQGTVSAILGGSAGLNKTTAGTVILSRANTYTGATNITGGTLQAGAANVIVNTSAVTVGAGATFDLNNFNQSVGSLAGGGTVTLGAAGLTIGSDDTDTTFSGIIEGAGSLTKVGTGTQTLSGVNNYTGGTTLNNGGLIVNNNSALGSGTLTITSAGGPTSLGSTANNTTLNIPISLQGDVSVSTSGFGENFILNGNVDVGAVTRTITGTTLGGQVQFGAGGISGLGGVTFATTFTNPDEYVAFIFNGANTNNYSGLTTIGNGAFLVFQGTAADGAILGDVLVEGNGVIDYLGGNSQQISDNASVTVNSLGNSVSGTGFGGFDLFQAQGTERIGQLFGTGTVWLSNSTLEVGSGDFSGVISDGTHGAAFTGGNLTKIGVGTLVLSGANTYTGLTTIAGGVLQAAQNNTFSAASAIVVDPAGTLELDNFNQVIGTLADGTGGGGVVNLAGATLTLGASNASSAFSGTINGTGGLTKVGAGVFNLTGTNNYTGTTAVNGGALVLDSALIGPVTVDGAEFDISATGSVTLGAGVTGVAMNDGGLTNNAGNVTVGDNSTGISAVTNNVINNTGTITGGATGSVGVLLSGAGNTLINGTGATITATTGVLLTNPAGTNTIVNRGTITGTGGIAIDNSVAAGAMNLTNFGTINGAVLFGTAGDTLTFVTGVPTFPANGGGGADTLRLVGTRGDTLNIAQITNFESLVKLGGGNWTLDGTGFFPGGTSIQLGELYVRGTLNSPVAVMHDGLLGGTGLIGGRVTNFGVVNPGTVHGSANAIGKLSISGDYQQAKSGTLVIEVRGKKPGQYDVLAIDGRAQIDGALRIERVGKSPRLKVGERLAFLTASNGVDGKFSDVANPLSSNTMVRPEVVYEKNAVVIAGVQASYKEFADQENLTPNQRAAAGAVDDAAFGRNARKDKMIEYLNERTLDKLPNDLDLVAPEEIAAVYRMSVAMADTQARNIQQRTEEIRLTNRRPLRAPTPPVNGAAGAVGNEQVSAKRVVATEPEDRWGSFFTGSGQVARVGRTDNAREYDMETGGITVGVDYQLTPNLVVGIMAGYANMAAQLVDDGSISANGGKLGVYGTYFKDGFHADAAVTGGFNSYEINRAALEGMARGKTEGQEWSALIGAGYLWGEKAFKLEPTVSAQYTYMELDAFTERGSLAPLKVASQHEESFRSTLGMKAAYEWNLGHVLVRPELMVAWQHEFGERSFTLDSALASGASGAFTVQDSGLGRDGLLLSGGVSVLWEGGTLMYLRYDGDLLRKEYEAHNLSGGVQLTF